MRVKYGGRPLKAGDFIMTDGVEADAAVLDGEKVIRIVLTIAHLDGDVENNTDQNLAALCQRCHNRLDVNQRKRKRNRSHTLSEKKAGLTALLPGMDATNELDR